VPSLERVVALTPDSYSGYNNLGGIYLRLGRTDEAERMLRKSLSLRPTANAYYTSDRWPTTRHDYVREQDVPQGHRAERDDDRLWARCGLVPLIPGRTARHSRRSGARCP